MKSDRNDIQKREDIPGKAVIRTFSPIKDGFGNTIK